MSDEQQIEPAPEQEPVKVDINSAIDRQMIVHTIMADLDDDFASKAENKYRKRFAMSWIGEPCLRRLWYRFRWAQKSGEGWHRTAAESQKVFDDGNDEEIKFHELLTKLGFQLEQPPDKQLYMEDIHKHFVGFCDNTGYLPKKFRILDRVLFEYKTMNQNGFSALSKKCFSVAEEKYWAQCVTYASQLGIKWVFIVVKNKNTGQYKMYLLPASDALATMYRERAKLVITAQVSPQRVARQQTDFSCKFCEMKDICWNGKAMDINCRSCQHARPIEDAQWACDLHQIVIPKEHIETGCGSYQAIQQII